MMKNTFYCTLKDLFVFKIFECPNLFGHVEKRVDKVNFKIYNVTYWEIKVLFWNR